MKNFTIQLAAVVVSVVALNGCISSQKYNDLTDQNRRLESQLVKERQENADLNSFRFSLESQFKQKSEQYVRCQEDQKETVESLTIKYNQVAQDYEKLVLSYKKLNETYEASKDANSRVIQELEEKTRQLLTAKPRRSRRARK